MASAVSPSRRGGLCGLRSNVERPGGERALQALAVHDEVHPLVEECDQPGDQRVLRDRVGVAPGEVAVKLVAEPHGEKTGPLPCRGSASPCRMAPAAPGARPRRAGTNAWEDPNR